MMSSMHMSCCRARSSLSLRVLFCCLLPVFALILFCSTLLILQWQRVSYLLRPIWDTPPTPFQPLVHHYAPNLSSPELCSLHGWSSRSHPRRVFDAIIFNHELDLLEIRWRELAPLVSKFLLIESNSTFTGRPKALLFAANRHRFSFAGNDCSAGGRSSSGSCIVYKFCPGRKLGKGESPFELEKQQRVMMGNVLAESGIRDGDLVIMSDTDEIPSAHTIDLFRWCDGVPPILHLQMNNYLYSFEFLVDKASWRAAVVTFRHGSAFYNHMRKADVIFPDSGWHCSFCFRHIRDFAHKMQGYSHADRVRDPSFLRHERIQEIICKGNDIFDMLPEEYSFKELIAKMGSVPHSYSAVNLPAHLLRNPEKFRYLLPGNCVREST